jgi:type IV pilus assembly protein PilM
MLENLILKPEPFGLDVSDLSLKIAKLKKKKNYFKLSSFGEIELKPGVVISGEIKNGESFSKSLKELIRKINGEKLKTKHVVVSLPEEKSFLQVIKLPKIKEEEIDNAVRFEAENYVPVSIDQVYLDFQVVPPLSGELNHLDVLIAAVPKKIVDPYLFYLKEAGLKPIAFEIESQAISRALVKNELSTSPLLLIDLGATRTSFIGFSGHSLRTTSSISVSSQNFTEAISNNLKVDLAEAEKMKRKHGLEEKIKLKPNSSTNLISERGEIFESLIPSLADLAQQIKKYLDYYKTHNFYDDLPDGKKSVTKILLSGGGANLKGLVNFLSLELKIPVELANPWVNILPEKLKELPKLPFDKSLGFTTALGLALRGIKTHD